MTPLFKRLSEENQRTLRASGNSHLMISLQTKCYEHHLTIKDMMEIGEVFHVDYFKLSNVLELFKN